MFLINAYGTVENYDTQGHPTVLPHTKELLVPLPSISCLQCRVIYDVLLECT